MFDHVIVAVAARTHKNTLFTLDERLEMMQEILKSEAKNLKNVSVETFKGLVVNFAREKKVKVLIRGLRMISDFEYEFQMALTNRRFAEDIETVFMMPSEGYSFLSSTLLKEAAALGADLSSFVPPFIEKKIKTRLQKC